MNTLCHGAAILLLIPLGSMAHPAPPDSSAVPRRHLLTLHTLHVASPFVPALGYEVAVRPRLGLRASLGATHNSLRYYSSYTDPMGNSSWGTTHHRYLGLVVDASLNYYLQAHKPALTGWFVGAGVLTSAQQTRVTYSDPVRDNRTSHYLVARPMLRGGRHWALGPRWLVDTHVGAIVWSYPYRRFSVEAIVGVGAGYRF